MESVFCFCGDGRNEDDVGAHGAGGASLPIRGGHGEEEAFQACVLLTRHPERRQRDFVCDHELVVGVSGGV